MHLLKKMPGRSSSLLVWTVLLSQLPASPVLGGREVSGSRGKLGAAAHDWEPLRLCALFSPLLPFSARRATSLGRVRVLRGVRGGGEHQQNVDCPGCTQGAVKRVVNKAGANKGRTFYCCGRQTSSACRSFFKWADVPPRAAGTAAPPPQPVHPNVTVIRRVCGKSGGGVALQDARGSLLAVSPHPRTIHTPAGASSSPSPHPGTREPGAPVAPSFADGKAASELGGSAFSSLAANPVAPGQPVSLPDSRPLGTEQDRNGPSMATDEGAFQGFAMASGAPIKVAPLKGAPPFGLPASAVTLSGTPHHAAGGGRGWAGEASGFAALASEGGALLRDPRTEPTVGCEGEAWYKGGAALGHEERCELGGGESVTMPGWPLRAAQTPVKSPAFKPPRPAREDDPLPNHPLLSTSRLAQHVPQQPQRPELQKGPGQLAAPSTAAEEASRQQEDGQWQRGGGPLTRAPRQTRHGPILCGNGSTGEFRSVDFMRSTTGAAQCTLQMVGASWRLVDCNIRCHGGIAVMCVKAAEVAVDSCTIGGSSEGSCRASDGIVAMCDATCSLEDSLIEWSSNVGVLAHVGKSEATVSNCTLRWNFIASGVDDGATLSLCGNKIMDNVHGAVFVGRDAALAEVELCTNRIHGTLWLGSKASLARLTELDNIVVPTAAEGQPAGLAGGGGPDRAAECAEEPGRGDEVADGGNAPRGVSGGLPEDVQARVPAVRDKLTSVVPDSCASTRASSGSDSAISSAQRLLAQGTGHETRDLSAAAANASVASLGLDLLEAEGTVDGEDSRRVDCASVGARSLAGSLRRQHPRPSSSEPPASSLSTRHVRRKLWSPVDGSGGAGLGASSRASLTPGVTSP